jgi:glycosyltransferase involved in cell wall biosynthesis
MLTEYFDLTIIFSYPTKKKRRKIPDLKNGIKFNFNIFKGINFINGAISIHPDMLKFVKSQTPDVLILENRIGFATTWLLALLNKKKTKVIWWLSGHESSRTQTIRYIKRILNKFILKSGSGYICYSNSGKDFLNSLGIFKNIFIAHNSIDTNIIFETQREQKYLEAINNKDRSNFALISTGRIEKLKNIQLIIESVRYLRNIIPGLLYYCIGDGSYLPVIKELVKKFNVNDNVIFIGEETNENELCKYFAVSDVYILPGTGGLGLNHALAYGKPVILSEGDGTERELVTDKINGLYFLKNNLDSLIEKILLLYNNRDLQKEMSNNSAEKCRNFYNINSMVNGFKKAIFTKFY